MTERPILFTAAMLQAILDGTKTETRRVVKPRFPAEGAPYLWPDGRIGADHIFGPERLRYEVPEFREIPCPYGTTGDLLHVGEPLIPRENVNGYTRAIYERDGAPVLDQRGLTVEWRWKVRKLTSMYTPKAYRRLWLRVLDEHPERLQDIASDPAAIEREGVSLAAPQPASGLPDYTRNLRELWDSINGKRGYPWDSNPWVWVLRFEVASTTGRPEEP